ncbi:MAG TPA: hypothetical protein PKD20_02030, partial [Candidatus Saccharibacteria bacterium]|nr:hypothetical protein [Candidatus Saccharibacteria bacterium]
MKLRKNRETPPGRQPQIEPRQNANIMRYYRPEHKEPMVRRVSTLKQPATKNDSAKHTFSRLSSVFIQWSIVGVIIILLIMNISLSSTTVRVKGSSYHYRSIEDYQRITDGILTKQLAYRSKITLSSERLESEIRTAIPEAEEVVAVVPLAGRQLQVILH